MLPYVPIPEAMGLGGLRLVLSPGVPGPWGEAAKAIFEVKGIDYIPVAHNIGVADETLRRWTGQESAPVAMFDLERPRVRWDEILLLAERLAPEPRLVPVDPSERVTMFGLSHEICGEEGIGWNLRLCVFAAQAKRAASSDASVMSGDQLKLFQTRYGDATRSAAEAAHRVAAMLSLLAERLHANHARGSRYMIGEHLTALNIYWTVFSNLVCPIPHGVCPMPDTYREMGTSLAAELAGTIDPVLIAHRDDMLNRHFKLPMHF
jgi:hypothetical protein